MSYTSNLFLITCTKLLHILAHQSWKTNSPSKKWLHLKPLSKHTHSNTFSLIKTKGSQEQLFASGHYEQYLWIKLFSIVKSTSTWMKLPPKNHTACYSTFCTSLETCNSVWSTEAWKTQYLAEDLLLLFFCLLSIQVETISSVLILYITQLWAQKQAQNFMTDKTSKYQ